MTGELTIGAAFMAGLLGSGHCLGMCGGIAGALGMGADGTPGRRLALVLLYNIGRILSYGLAGAAVGTAAGWLGGHLDIPGWSGALRTLTGVLLIAIGLQLAFGWTGLRRIEALGLPVWRRIAPRVGALLPVRNARSGLALGFMWGWLPCGLVYTMLLAAMLTGNTVSGAMVMIAFGAGTLPAMTGVALAGNSLAPLTRRRAFRAAAGVLVAMLGLWTALVPWVGSHGGHGAHSATGDTATPAHDHAHHGNPDDAP